MTPIFYFISQLYMVKPELKIMHFIKVVVLFVLQYGLGMNEENVNSCVICLGNNGELVRMCEHHCGNLFHRSCWLECMRYDPRCPMCRRVQHSYINNIPVTEPLLSYNMNTTQRNISDASRFLSRYFPFHIAPVNQRAWSINIVMLISALWMIFLVVIIIVDMMNQQHQL